MSTERLNECLKQLAAAVELQAVKDYCNRDTTPKKRKQILRSLRGRWMKNLTRDHSLITAEQLELHADEIAVRVYKYESEEFTDALP